MRSMPASAAAKPVDMSTIGSLQSRGRDMEGGSEGEGGRERGREEGREGGEREREGEKVDQLKTSCAV